MVDVSAQLTDLYGVQDAIAVTRYAYARLTAGKKIEIFPSLTIGTFASYGYKAFYELPENRHDVQLDVDVPFGFFDGPEATIAVHAAWTELATERFAGECFV